MARNPFVRKRTMFVGLLIASFGVGCSTDQAESESDLQAGLFAKDIKGSFKVCPEYPANCTAASGITIEQTGNNDNQTTTSADGSFSMQIARTKERKITLSVGGKILVESLSLRDGNIQGFVYPSLVQPQLIGIYSTCSIDPLTRDIARTFQQAKITGTIRLADGTPIKGMYASIFADRNQHVGYTGANGAFEFNLITPLEFDRAPRPITGGIVGHNRDQAAPGFVVIPTTAPEWVDYQLSFGNGFTMQSYCHNLDFILLPPS